MTFYHSSLKIQLVLQSIIVIWSTPYLSFLAFCSCAQWNDLVSLNLGHALALSRLLHKYNHSESSGPGRKYMAGLSPCNYTPCPQTTAVTSILPTGNCPWAGLSPEPCLSSVWAGDGWQSYSVSRKDTVNNTSVLGLAYMMKFTGSK